MYVSHRLYAEAGGGWYCSRDIGRQHNFQIRKEMSGDGLTDGQTDRQTGRDGTTDGQMVSRQTGVFRTN